MNSVNRPLISVIMGVYNQKNEVELRASVISILEQTLTDFEFIIYNDGSEPQCASLLEEISGLDSRIRLIGKKENHGLAYSLNECLAHAKGRYIARMDADDISHRDRLKRQYDFMENYPEYSWCGCNARLFDEDGTWGSRYMPELPVNKDFLRFSPYIHPSVMYRREVFERGNRYSTEEETLRCEDLELFMQLHIQGLRGYNIQEFLLNYRENKNSYNRRTMRSRVNESRVRLRNYRLMGILFPFGWICVSRPIISGLLPTRFIHWAKKKESDKRNEDRKHTAE